MSMLTLEMIKGTKCYIQGFFNSEYVESLGVIHETPNKHSKTVLVELAHSHDIVRCPVEAVYWVDQSINIGE